MKMHLAKAPGQNAFTAYRDGFVSINQVEYAPPLLVTPTLLEVWGVSDFAALGSEHFKALLEHQPEIVLLGTGRQQRFPHPRLTADLLHAGIGVEAMNNEAACRTFNILMNEDRRVLVVLLP